MGHMGVQLQKAGVGLLDLLAVVGVRVVLRERDAPRGLIVVGRARAAPRPKLQTPKFLAMGIPLGITESLSPWTIP